MKNRVPTTILSTLLLPLAFACAPSEEGDAGAETGEAQSSMATGNVVDVTAVGFTFQVPDSIPSGWTTFRFVNSSAMIHFALVWKLPEAASIEEHQEVAARVFQEGYELMLAGGMDAANAKFGELPAWFGDLVAMGGPGLTAAASTSQASLYLEPGTYLLECYVKTDGVFHSYNPEPGMYGMVKEFTVTAEKSGNPEPTADVNVTISSGAGIRVDGDLTAGEQTVAVHFEDQTTYPNFAGHDVHVARLAEGTDMETLAAWMDWTREEGMADPAPVEFIGGTNEVPAGQTSYFTVTLEEGDYAFISEVPDPAAKNMLHTFTVGGGG